MAKPRRSPSRHPGGHRACFLPGCRTKLPYDNEQCRCSACWHAIGTRECVCFVTPSTALTYDMAMKSEPRCRILRNHLYYNMYLTMVMPLGSHAWLPVARSCICPLLIFLTGRRSHTCLSLDPLQPWFSQSWRLLPDSRSLAGGGRDSQPVNGSLPFEYYGVPYYGPGEVEIGPGGTLLVRIGAVDVPPSLEAWAATAESVVEAVQFRFDAEGARLVVARGEAFLDRYNRESDRRGLIPAEVERSVVVSDRVASDKHGITPLFRINGVLDLEYDAATGHLSLTAYGYDEDSLVFSLDAAVRPRGASDVAAGQVAGESQQISADAPFILYGGDPPASSSYCTIDCTGGTANITCYDSGCYCKCKNGKPQCACVSSS